MIIKDYENEEKYQTSRENYIQRLKKISSLNSNDDYDILSEIINKGLEQEANINSNGIIYNILISYATNRLPKKQLNQPKKYNIPYINSTNLKSKIKIIRTNDTEIKFRLIVGNYFELIQKLITENHRLKNLYIDLYKGNSLGKCHELCAKYPQKDYNIVTAYIPDIFSNLFVLHTFQQKNDKVVDLSNNIIWNKNVFYNLLNPEIISVIPSKQLIKDLQNHKIHGNLKDYFANYPKIKM